LKEKMTQKERDNLIHCGYCNADFKNYKMLEYLADKGNFAKSCPSCGIAEYEKGANFTEKE
jgi:hypothetical protein